MKIVFATNNLHKLNEIRNAVDPEYHISSLSENGIMEDIPETQDTLEGNAIEKARYIAEKYGFHCFADDTGLEVDALNGRPGVFSARYAGPACSFDDNINKLLLELKDRDNRRARFRTVIAYVEHHKIHTFEGMIEGMIIRERRGTGGFGYDPVFLPRGSELTFAEMPLDEKNQISHRALAVKKFIRFLSERKNNHFV